LDAGFDDDLDFGKVPAFKRPAATPAVLTTHPATNAAAALQATQVAAAAAAGSAAGHAAAAAASGGLFGGKAYGGAQGVEGSALRVLRALAEADGAAVSGCVLRLWQAVHSTKGAAPAEQLVEEMADVMVTAVCSGPHVCVIEGEVGPIECARDHARA
jgi:hypothetical protein